VTKVTIENVDNVKCLRPVLNSDLSIGISMDAQSGRWSSETRYVKARTGHKFQISEAESGILKLVDGQRAICGEIVALLNGKLADRELEIVFTDLQRRGFISFLFPPELLPSA